MDALVLTAQGTCLRLHPQHTETQEPSILQVLLTNSPQKPWSAPALHHHLTWIRTKHHTPESTGSDAPATLAVLLEYTMHLKSRECILQYFPPSSAFHNLKGAFSTSNSK